MLYFQSLFSFTIDDLDADEVLVINLNVSFCLDSAGDCEFHIAIFNETRFPKQVCTWNKEFTVKGIYYKDRCEILRFLSGIKIDKSLDLSHLFHSFALSSDFSTLC
jgi:hypothetical protein